MINAESLKNLLHLSAAPALILSPVEPFEVRETNNAFEAMGQPLQDGIKGLSVFFVLGLSSSHETAKVKQIRHSLQKAIKTGKPTQVSSVYLKPGSKNEISENSPWQIRNIPIVNEDNQVECIFQTFNNIRSESNNATEKKRLDLEMQMLLSNTDESFILVDKSLKIVAFNDQCNTLYKNGFGKEIIKGTDILDYAISGNREELNIVYQKVLKGNTKTQEIQVETALGPKSFLIKYKPALNEDGKISGAFITGVDNTEAALARRQIEESERKYKILFESNPLPVIIWDFETMQIIDCNEQAIALYGYSKEEFLQLKTTQIRPAEDINLLKRHTVTEEAYGKIHKKVWRHKKKNGQVMMIEVHGQLVDYNGRRVSITQNIDVTEKIKYEEKLKESEERFKVLFYNSPMPIWVYDLSTLRILDVNDRAINHYGYSRAEFLSMTVNDLKPTEELARVDRLREQIERGEGLLHFGVFAQLKKDKSKIKADVSGNKLSFRGRNCMMIVSNDVTERERVLSELKEKEERLLSAQRIAKLGYWQTIPGTGHLFWSDMVYDIWGVKKETVHLDLDFFKNSLHPDDVEVFMKERALVFAGKKDHDLQHRILLPDGSVKWVHEKGKLVMNPEGDVVLFEGTVRDITSEKELSLSLQASNERFEKVAEATNDIIWEWDMVNQRTIRGSKEARKLFAGNNTVNQQQVISLSPGNIHPDDVEAVVSSINNAIRTTGQSTWEVEYRFLKADGTYMYVMDRGFITRDENGKAIRMVGAMTDITERKDYEQSLRLLNEELGKANKELALSNADLEQFAYIASHDLQEPLRMVSSFLTQIEKKYGDQLDEKGKKYIYFAVDGAKRMRQIILDLLEYSRVGRGENVKEVVDLQELVDETIILQRRQIEDTKAEIKTANLPVIETCKTALRQVFQNLVSNSLRYCKKGKDAERLRISIDCTEEETCWLFSVKDNGIGIHKDFFERIFIMFQRLHTNEEYSGTGIGLAITKKIIGNLGGKIWLESEVNKGSTFYFTLPKSGRSEASAKNEQNV